MQNFFDFTREELKVLLKENFNAPSFVGDQLFDWVYKKGQKDFDLMTNVSKQYRESLKSFFTFKYAEVIKREISNDGTRKYLLKVPSGKEIETVLINQVNRKTLCVSSQYGCGMAWSFCRTGTMGFLANLETADIIAQVMAINEDAKEFNDSFSNMVFMGMGEPLHNYKGVTRALKILTDPLAFEIGPRRITVSTVGLVPAIKKFAKEELGVNLAVSLNATTDEVRSQIMPVNKNFPIKVLLDTLREFPLTGKRRITIEYVMLAGINDTMDDIKRLVRILDGIKCKINLIPYNDNAGLGFKTPSRNHVFRCLNMLTASNMDATVRWSKGNDIKAACGQLVTSVNNENKERSKLVQIIQ